MEMASSTLQGAAMCRATGRRGATSCLETMPTLRSSQLLPWEDHSAALAVIRGSQPQMDGACSHQTDGTPPANHLLALRAARTLRRTGYIEGPDWSDQLTATYFARQLRHPLTLGLQPTFVMLVLTIFSCGGLNYWSCHPRMKSQTGKVIQPLIG